MKFPSIFTSGRRTKRRRGNTPRSFQPTLRLEKLEERRVLSGFSMAPIAAYHTEVFDEAGTEIVAYEASTSRIFSTNLADHTIDIVDISGLAIPAGVGSLGPSELTAIGTGDDLTKVDVSMLKGSLTSVAVKDGLVAASARNGTKKGEVAFFAAEDMSYIGKIKVGVGPDMVTFTPDGSKLLVANEGQANDNYTVDPEGSVSIIDVSSILTEGVPEDRGSLVTTAKFNKFNSQADELRESGVRIFGPNATVAKDLEPEYITAATNDTAYVVLQDNNAVATLDIASGTFTAITGLGYKDHLLEGNELDTSDKDKEIDIQSRPVFGMYQPDGIASYTVGGELYLLTANEGAGRDEDGYSEEERVGDLVLDEGAFPDAEELQGKKVMGRLKVTSELGDTDGDGDYDELYAFGARSFSIWNADVEQVYDSGSDFEDITAAAFPENFNATNDDNNFDNRSDDKGPEPSTVVVGEIDGTPYAFTALERVGGIMVYDVTDPANPTFVTYVNNRDFGVDIWIEDPEDPDEEILGPDWQDAGDLHVEGLKFVSAADSPVGSPLIITANEVSGTVTVFVIDPGESVSPAPVESAPAHDAALASLDGLDLLDAQLNGKKAKGGKAGSNAMAKLIASYA